MNQQQALHELIALPPDAQYQVFEFIAFLRTRYSQNTVEEKFSQTSLAEEPFIGMWRDREDLQDSSAWVRNLREQEWTLKHG